MEGVLRLIIQEFGFEIRLLVLLGILWLAQSLLGINLLRIVANIAGEFKDLSKLKWTRGSLNAVSLILLAIVISAHLIPDAASLIERVLVGRLGETRAEQYIISADPLIMFWTFAIVGLISVFALPKK